MPEPIPQSKVVVAATRGGPEALHLTDRPVPRPGDGEVLVKVAAAGVAFGDIMVREGLVRDAPRPLNPGYDVAGMIVGVGTGVMEVSVGQKVVASTGGWGGYATHVVVPSWRVVPYTSDIRPEVATSLVLDYLTAYQMLRRTTNLEPGATVLIHSAAGGVGSALVQLGALRGLNKFGTSSAGKATYVARMGAVPIDYRNEDFVARIRQEAPNGLDAIFDGLGVASWRRGFPLLRSNGQLVPYGAPATLKGGVEAFHDF